MQREQIEQAIRLADMLRDAGMSTNAYKASNLYIQLRKVSRAYTNADTAMCNGWLDDTQHEKKTDRLFNKIEKIAAQWLNDWEYQGVLYHYHQTDPRGCALYVSTKPIEPDTYNTSALAIW